MKTAWIAAFVLLFVSAAGFAQAPAPLAQSPASLKSSCPPSQNAVFLAAKPARPARPGGLEKALCSATAQCASGTVSCNGNNSSTSCHAYDRDCPWEQGHVTCDGVTTWCSQACEDPCSSGTMIQQACCRCYTNYNCWDCYFCAYGYYTLDACP